MHTINSTLGSKRLASRAGAPVAPGRVPSRGNLQGSCRPLDIQHVTPHGEKVGIRGFVAERIVYSTVLDPYMSLKALAAYSGLSTSRLRALIDGPPGSALPCYRINGGKLLVRRSEYDAWVSQYRTVGRPSLALAAKELGLA
jgi:hypothetical protein